MITTDTIFSRLGGPAEVGRIIGKTTEHATLMKRRGSIPVAYWPKLIAAAVDRGLGDITPETLLAAHSPSKSEEVSA